MTFQRKKPAAIGVKAPFPGFIETAFRLASSLQSYSGWSISGPVCYTTPPSIIFAQAALSFFETDALHRCSGLGQADPAHFPRAAPVRDLSFVGHRQEEFDMDMDTNTLLIIIVVIVLLVGGGWYGRGRWY